MEKKDAKKYSDLNPLDKALFSVTLFRTFCEFARDVTEVIEKGLNKLKKELEESKESVEEEQEKYESDTND